MRRIGVFAAVVSLMVAPLVAAGVTSASASGTSVIYTSLVASPLPGNIPSIGGEAYSFNEFGNEITFAPSTNRQLTNVVLELSSWGCYSGSWYANNCSTPSGATFNEPITLNIYNPPANGSTSPGSLITSVTQTFAIPYRPSMSAKCTGGEWFDNSLKHCFNGYATNVTFNLKNVIVPDFIVYGVAYNTTHHGYNPIGEGAACYTSSGGCGYDSLNIALSQDPANVVVGTDTLPGSVWQNAVWGGEYCDGGISGIGTFRLDSPPPASCWLDPYVSGTEYFVPAIQFKAGAVGHG